MLRDKFSAPAASPQDPPSPATTSAPLSTQMRQSSIDNELPPHTGLLREEVLVLRDLLCYVDFIDDTTTLEPPQVGVPLPNSRMKDLLLVGLDIDTFQGYEQLTPDPQLHIGISLLDTR